MLQSAVSVSAQAALNYWGFDISFARATGASSCSSGRQYFWHQICHPVRALAWCLFSARAPAGFEPVSVVPYSFSVVFAEFASVSAVACKLSPCLWELLVGLLEFQ